MGIVTSAISRFLLFDHIVIDEKDIDLQVIWNNKKN